MMPWSFFLLCLLFSLSVSGQESVEFFKLHDSTSTQQALSTEGAPVVAALPNELLQEVSASVLTAEIWTRTHVLAHYPAMNITNIVVGHNLLCKEGQEHNFSLVLPTVRNIHYSLTRWGLQKEIKPSVSFSSSCLHTKSGTFKDNVVESHIKPLLSFLQDIESIYLVNPPSILTFRPHEALISLTSHSQALKNLGFLNLTKMSVITKIPKEAKPTSRKLSSMYSEMISSSPERPSPLSPAAGPSGSHNPSVAARSPLPPLIGTISPPPLSFPFAPQLPPMINPASPPFGLHLPPCNPSHGGHLAAAPVTGVQTGVWCVAKPSVPTEALQEALDYACGEGGADCEAIRPQGSCYSPDTVVAHASYAFNSYWQKTKRNGGICGFGGTAMLISSDPSYRHCRFILI